MIGYCTIGVTDMDKAKAFWGELLGEIGASVQIDIGRLAMIGTGMDNPMLAVCVPFDENDANPGNGNMVAFAPGSKELVDKLHAKALELGASNEGDPGQRIPDMFYGGYFRDPDGNKAVFFQFG
ncbi:MAG: VOC family protein [Rhodospirillaceae bacterium]|jgi:predicted lactoylglutathione lyase|nr:VOC family protein [Rhodospirillaceae bacterium]MBT4487250.1 VOC family protein [Rhodospirillaceae bacterium]MBT5191100.1 VOC family protein [Rhodospirillaceae bacterium]MBT5895649.1 VOC family protein [Rhodospirillaceae bacterium]MBT6429808.1 VOC family protein [Rhodospirillaceae bacterium]